MRRILLAAGIILMNITMAAAQKYYLLVGTYTSTSDSKGIYVYNFDGKTGKTEALHTVDAVNPEYFAAADNGKKIYVANENITDATKGQGAISAYTFDKKTATLTFLNKVPSLGDSPCFISVDNTGKNVFAANYMGGSFVAYKTQQDGALEPEKAQFFQFKGKGPHPNQEASHLHSTFIAPDQQYLFACNLGTDQIYKYDLSPKDATPLKEGTPAFYSVPTGYGPRHMVWSPNGEYVYVLCELAGKIIAFDYNKGDLKQLQITNSSPSVDEKIDKGSAAIRVSPDGKFLYVSNRGEANTIGIFSIAKDGQLTHVEDTKVKKHPRDFQLTPDGKFLAIASRDDNSVDIYKVDTQNGKITETGDRLDIPKPVAVLFLKK